MANYKNTVRVSLGNRSYEIVIRANGISHLGKYLFDLGFTGKVGVVTNQTVSDLYGKRVFKSLRAAGFQPHMILIPNGERAKTIRWVSQILDELVRSHFERGSVLVALGGGVIGDVTGFAAAIYLRGISFVQVATTLVAQVDSSVGGKTGINHHLGKNLIGAFYQPCLVLLDTEALLTLPKREWVAGLAEVIKYGMIADGKFFSYLEDHMTEVLRREASAVQYMVKRCCEIKASVVAADEREAGWRRVLNYGHTIGHALESLGQYRKFIHGEAVGVGMVCEADLARVLGYCSGQLVKRQFELIQRVGLPVDLPSMKFGDLWSAILYDKKVVGGKVNCVVPRAVGKVEIVTLRQSAVKRWFHSCKLLKSEQTTIARRYRFRG